jgi:methylated-DNA-[protein]-cysteine S-methyltransferase
MITSWMEEQQMLGPVTVVCGSSGLLAVLLGPVDVALARLERRLRQPVVSRSSELADDALRQLREYAAGERTVFDLPCAPFGTAFQRDVWEAVAAIPYGETTTYAEIARRVGRPTAPRAVGAANGANPLCIVIPCHRVIGHGGKLTGYAHGLPLKERLLKMEALVSDRLPVA